MNTINSESYSTLNKAMYDLEEILGSIGVKELFLSHDKRNMSIDTSAEAVDNELLQMFCKHIAQLHIDKFGNTHTKNAA